VEKWYCFSESSEKKNKRKDNDCIDKAHPQLGFHKLAQFGALKVAQRVKGSFVDRKKEL
jgi:hypothetical protein